MPDYTPSRVFSAGLDWITATAKPEGGADALARLGGELVARERDAGNRQKDWQWWYYTGLTAGHATFGTRRDGTILRVSGALADTWGASIAALADNLTRCDLQVTYLDSGCNAGAEVIRLWESQAQPRGRGRPPYVKFIRNRDTGETIYAGKRTSEEFGRIYDKHAIEPALYPAGAVRAEVEVKGDRAQALRGRIADGRVDSTYAVSLARSWYRRRGITLPLPDGGDIQLDAPPRAPTDATRTLAYLTRQVAPSVARSIQWSGLWATLSALGLDGHVSKLVLAGPRPKPAS